MKTVSILTLMVFTFAFISIIAMAGGARALPLSGTGFAGFATDTSVDGQSGWSSTGSWDEEVVEEDGTGNIVWRVSNASTSGSFGNMPFAPRPGGIPTDTMNHPVNSEPLFFAGESSTGAAFTRFSAQFSFRSAMNNPQEGLYISASIDNGQGARQSYVALVDNDSSGIDLVTYDVDKKTGEFIGPITIASDLSYTDWHTVEMQVQFVDGPQNDTVKYYVDGKLVHVGPSWEEFYRQDPNNEGQDELHPLGVPVQTLIFPLRGTAASSVEGGGFYIDNVFTSNS